MNACRFDDRKAIAGFSLIFQSLSKVMIPNCAGVFIHRRYLHLIEEPCFGSHGNLGHMESLMYGTSRVLRPQCLLMIGLLSRLLTCCMHIIPQNDLDCFACMLFWFRGLDLTFTIEQRHPQYHGLIVLWISSPTAHHPVAHL
jgi:hypothetical protein